MNKLWGLIKRHKIVTSILFTAVMVTAVLGVQITPTKTLNKSSMSIGQIGQKYEITIGSGVDASTTADYTATGTAAQQTNTFQIALNALPTTGGILTILSGNYTLNATLTRAIPNVTIEGIGNSTIFSDNGSTPIFAAGTGWNFQNLVLDAGGISGTCTGSNITIGTTYYSVYGGFNAPTGRTASYVIAASNSSALDKIQADYVSDGSNEAPIIAAAIALGYRDFCFSEGTHYVAGVVLTSNLHLEGAGRELTIFSLPNASNTDMFTANTTNITDVCIESCNLEGNRTNNTSSRGIYATGITYLTLRDVFIDNFYDEGLYGLCSASRTPYDTGWWTLDNVIVRKCGQPTSAGLKSGIYAEGVYAIFGNVLDTSYNYGRGMQLVYTYECTFSQITVDQNSESGTNEVGVSVYGGKHNDFIGGYFGPQSYGLYLYSAELVNVSGINFAQTDNFIVIAGNSKDITIVGNTTDNADFTIAYIGIQIADASDYVIISKNSFSDYTIPILNTATGTHNLIEGNTGYIASGEIRTVVVPLVGSGVYGIPFKWHNPELQDILVRKVTIIVTTGGGTVGSIGQVGICDDGAINNFGTEFFTGTLLNNVGITDSWNAGDTGVQTKWILVQDSGSATKGWIAMKIQTQAATNLVGFAYIEYQGY